MILQEEGYLDCQDIPFTQIVFSLNILSTKVQ